MGRQRQPCGGLAFVCRMFRYMICGMVCRMSCRMFCSISCGVGRSSTGGLLSAKACLVLIGRGLPLGCALLSALLPGLVCARLA